MPQATPAGKLRIIAGTLRGSRIAVPNAPGLRPTPERVRETLFNWLAPVIEGASCLDLFAGTGALGIEAWSRGARPVTFVERDAGLATALRGNLARLRLDDAAVQVDDALGFLQQAPVQRCDVVFLDPPFAATLWSAAAQALLAREWLKPDAWIYVETPLESRPDLPAHWAVHRFGRAGDVAYALYRQQNP